jgi:L-ascorbate metabolism protein UlaG (beta-lactamase superfamily)
VAERIAVDTAVLHLGGVRFPLTGPLRYSMPARQAVELRGLIRPRTMIPVHYEGWNHFQESRDTIQRVFATAPDEVRRAVHWLPLGGAVELAA